MKKLTLILLSAILSLGVLAPAVHADDQLFGFMDGKFYNDKAVLIYFCFMDGNCYDMNMNLAPIKFKPIIMPTTPTPPPAPVVPAQNQNVANIKFNSANPTPDEGPLLLNACGKDDKVTADSKTNYVMWQDTATIGGGNVKLNTLTLRMFGSIPPSSFSNFRLLLNGNEVAQQPNIDGDRVNFQPTTNLVLPVGDNTITVKGDIAKGVSMGRNFQWSLSSSENSTAFSDAATLQPLSIPMRRSGLQTIKPNPEFEEIYCP